MGKKSESEKDFVIPPELQPGRPPRAANAAYARGVAQATEQFAANTRGQLETALGDLRRVTPDRDRCQAARDSYERTYDRVRDAAQRVAGIDGKPVSIPKFLPPPQRSEEYVTVGPAPFGHGHYRETKGLGPSGKGVPPVIPGSGADHDWINRDESLGGGMR